MKKSAFIICIFLFLILTSCGKALNPYHEDFDCQARGEGGKCADTDTVYQDLSNTKFLETIIMPNEKTTPVNKPTPEPKNDTSKIVSKDIDTSTLSSSILSKLPTSLPTSTPLLKQPEVIRILILPYVDEKNRLYMRRYVYTVNNEPKWNIGNN